VTALQLAIEPRADDSSTKAVNKGNHSMTTATTDAPTSTVDEGHFDRIPVDLIDFAPDNPRHKVGDVSGLVASMKAVGVLEPIIVAEAGENGRYPLIAGARRVTAARLAELVTIPAMVRSLDGVQRALAMTTENTERENLTPLEEATAYQWLMSFGLDVETVSQHTGRSTAELDGRLAVLKLPAKVQKMLRDRSMEWAEAALLTQLAEYPEDIDQAVKHFEGGYDMGSTVSRIQQARVVTIKTAETTATLERQGVTIITPKYGYLDYQTKEKPLGKGYGQVDVKLAAHKKEPCHAAYIDRAGKAVHVCSDPKRHSKAGPGAPTSEEVKAERAAKRAAAKARREAATARSAVAAELLSGGGLADAELQYAIGAVLDHAPREVLPAAARLIGLEVPAGQGWDASQPAETALRNFIETPGEALRVAVAIHAAIAEKDAAAEFAAHRGGFGVLAYTDLLVAHGYVETDGDAANRLRYAPSTVTWDDDETDDVDGDDTEDDEA
jgi:ParB/RepB/Spo0J family partition protein